MSEQFKEIIKVANNINPTFGEIVQSGMEYAPYLGKLYQTIKVNRLIRRFNEHSEKLENIGQLSIDSRLSAEFINERIFPIVFSDLFEEHEDAKINYILTGFENVFIEENKHESLVISFFDTLRSLRYADIKRLFYFSNIIKEPLFSFLESDDHVLQRNNDHKLESLGLVSITKMWSEQEKDTNKEDVRINLYGDRFLKFILEKDILEEYLSNK
ncbi:hypothetical protein [Paenibacillus amylolyticus]|uniref:hypothetical protein n=1 Tax=Paenibacillus amylolyticus TaxID=1451 RepID=UPI003391FC26